MNDDEEYERILSNIKLHQITGYVSYNNKSKEKDIKGMKDNESSRKEK